MVVISSWAVARMVSRGGFQLFQVLAGTPTGHIAKGIVGGVQPVVLADGIGHAFGLHLAGAAVGAVGLLNGRGFRVDGVELEWAISWMAVFRVCNSLMPS